MISALALALISTVAAAPAVVESPFGLITTLGNEKIYDDFVVYARNDGSLWLGQQLQNDTPSMLGAMDIEGRVQPFNGNSLFVGSDGALLVADDNKRTEFTINAASHLQDIDGNIAMSGCPSGDSFQVFSGRAECVGRIDFALTAVTGDAIPLTNLSADLEVKQNFCCLKSCFKCGGCSHHGRPSGCSNGCAPAPPAPCAHVPTPAPAPIPAPSCTHSHTPAEACPTCGDGHGPIVIGTHREEPTHVPSPVPAPIPTHSHPEDCGCTGDFHEAPCTHHNNECSACPKDKICGLCGHIPCPKNILCNLCNVRPCVCPKDIFCNKCKCKRCVCLKDIFCNKCNSNPCSCGPSGNFGHGSGFHHPSFKGPNYAPCQSCGSSPCNCPPPPPPSNWGNGDMNGNGNGNGNNGNNNGDNNGSGNGNSGPIAPPPPPPTFPCNNCGSSPCSCPPPPPPPSNWNGNNIGNGNGNGNFNPAPCSNGGNWNGNGQNCNACGVSPCACIAQKIACAKCHLPSPCGCLSKLKNFCPGKALCSGCNQCC